MDEGMKACPACGEAIQAVAHKCRYCGTDIDAYVATRDAAVERTLFAGHPQVIYHVGQYFLVVITLGLAWLVYWLRSKSIHFTVTSQRIRIERGLLSKSQDNLELFRVDHFDLLKPLGMRLLGLCELRMASSDAGMPSARLYGIAGLDGLADQLREYSLSERSRRKVMAVERL
jgi:uncharacterized membrane protein YdbT with pleckstrin-like domain